MISTLWIIILLMVVTASLFVVIPVLRFRLTESVTDNEMRKQKNRELFQQRLAELEDDLKLELVTQESFEKLKAELQRGFISDMDEAEKQSAKKVNVKTDAKATSKRVTPLLLTLVIPVISFLLYEKIGASRDLVLPDLIARLGTVESKEQLEEGLVELAAVLDERFSRHSDDVFNGYQLGNIYIQLERYNEAVAVFSQLAEGMEDSPDKGTVLGQQAQAQYLLEDSIMTDSTQAVIDEALILDPNQYAVLSILALESFLAEDFSSALNYWRRQLLQETPGTAQAAMLAERIAQTEALIPAELREQMNTGGSSVTVYVDVDDAIRDEIPTDMRLFIFARGETMPMPLAARTFSLEELPITLTLDDSMAMTPQFTLSSAPRAFVGASIGYTATAEAGDYRVVSDLFEVAEQADTIRLIIKDLVR